MRRILFKAKCKDTGKWVEGGYGEIPAPPQCFGETQPPEVCIVCADPRYTPDWNLPYKMVMVEVRPETVCQFTGFFDQNGDRIFEGDILNDTVSDGIATWVPEHGAFMIREVGHDGNVTQYHRLEGDATRKNTHIKGNIHDKEETT